MKNSNSIQEIHSRFCELENKKHPGTTLAHLSDPQNILPMDACKALAEIERSSYLIIEHIDDIKDFEAIANVANKRRYDAITIRILSPNLTLNLGESEADAMLQAFCYQQKERKTKLGRPKMYEGRRFGQIGLDETTIKKIRAQRRLGHTLRRISEDLKVSISAVCKHTENVKKPLPTPTKVEDFSIRAEGLQISNSLFAQVLVFLKTRRCDGTRSTYYYDLKRFFNFYKKHIGPNPTDPNEYTPDDFESFLIHQEEKGTKPAVVVRTFCGISSFFSYLLKKRKIEFNPVKTVNLPQVEKYEVTSEPFTTWELDELLTVAFDEVKKARDSKQQKDKQKKYFISYRNFVALYLLSDLGSRAGALLSVRLCDVSMRYGNTLLRMKGKRRTTFKQFAISQKCEEVLNNYLSLFFAEKDGNTLIFAARFVGNETSMSVKDLNRVIQKCVKRTQICEKRRGEQRPLKYTTHCFRTTWATQQEAFGEMSIAERQSRMDHSNPRQTMSYTKIATKSKDTKWVPSFDSKELEEEVTNG